MFIAKNKVRMNDTDMAGILYFANQFRFVHDALEDIFEAEGYRFDNLVNTLGMVFVIVHVEADYLQPLKVGDLLDVHVEVEKIGSTSITFAYNIFRNGTELVGTAKTVHVCVQTGTKTKVNINEDFRNKFLKYTPSNNNPHKNNLG